MQQKLKLLVEEDKRTIRDDGVDEETEAEGATSAKVGRAEANRPCQTWSCVRQPNGRNASLFESGTNQFALSNRRGASSHSMVLPAERAAIGRDKHKDCQEKNVSWDRPEQRCRPAVFGQDCALRGHVVYGKTNDDSHDHGMHARALRGFLVSLPCRSLTAPQDQRRCPPVLLRIRSLRCSLFSHAVLQLHSPTIPLLALDHFVVPRVRDTDAQLRDRLETNILHHPCAGTISKCTAGKWATTKTRKNSRKTPLNAKGACLQGSCIKG
jgi:hypothetical protein